MATLGELGWRRKRSYSRRKYSRYYGKKPVRRSYAKKKVMSAVPRRRRTVSTRQQVTKLIRAIVPRPELKYFDVLNQAVLQGTGVWQWSGSFANVFHIPCGTDYKQRVGNQVYMKMLELHFELMAPISAIRARTITDSAGGAGFGNVVDTLHQDAALRISVVTTHMNTQTNTPTDANTYIGDTQGNSSGGASEYHLQWDKRSLKAQRRTLMHDRRYMHTRGVQIATGTNDHFGNSNQDAVYGLGVSYRLGDHKRVFTFPGKGFKLQWDDATTASPNFAPLLYLVASGS